MHSGGGGSLIQGCEKEVIKMDGWMDGWMDRE